MVFLTGPRQAGKTTLARLSEQFPEAERLVLVRHLRQPERRGRVSVEPAAQWLAQLPA